MTGDDIEQLSEPSETKKDDEIAGLEKNLAKLKDDQNEERFIFVLILLIIVDIFSFRGMQSWGPPVAILFLEVVFLLVVARKCGVKDVAMLMDRVQGIMGSPPSKSKDD